MSRAGRREWIGLAVLTLPTLLLPLDMSVPHLRPSGTELLWIIDIHDFVISGCLVTMGTLGPRIGRRRPLMLGGAAFGLASVAAAFATSPATLIGASATLGSPARR